MRFHPTLRFHALVAAVVALLTLAPRATAAVSDAAFTEETFLAASASLDGTTGMAFAPDGSGRLFVARKTGTVRIVTAAGSVLPTPFADESTFGIHLNSECGLIGIAFDPAFTTNGYVYLFVTRTSSEQQIIRYTAVGDTGTARTILVPGLPTVGNNHDGGAVGIGRDGRLYWAIGDLGNFTGVDGDLSSLAAKIGRANRDGSVAPGNPFIDGAGGNNDYIWARGFRNPFTFTFQPGTGYLWVNNVGTSWEQVMVPVAGSHAGYNDYENNQPAGFLPPVLAYRTNGTVSRTIAAAGAVRSGGTLTVTTTASHFFRRGERITIAGVTNASFNGTVYVASTPSATSFTATQAGPDASSGGGSATTTNLGGSITGGTFLDSSAPDAAYRGDFFFGDFNSGRVVRADLDTPSSIFRVDSFATGHGNMIDLALGPDGHLYGVRYNGTILRWRWNASAQRLVVTPLHLQTDEGATAVFSVRLAQAPAADVSVSVTRSSGDTDLSVSSGSLLTFTPANALTPQIVTLAAAQDADATPDLALFEVSAPGIPTESVELYAVDDDTPEISVSPTVIEIGENALGYLSVSLTGPPPGTALLAVQPTSGSPDVLVAAGSVLTFTTANWATPQQVILAADADADAVNDTAVITVSGSGFTPRTVNVTVIDDDGLPPAITSTPPATAVVGATFTYHVEATGAPAPTFDLLTAPGSMSIDPATGLVSWIPPATGTVSVTVRAQNGIPPAATQSFDIQVLPDMPPMAHLTRPYPGEIVSGTSNEFFGDGHDDVGTVRGEFWIDGSLAYTDTTPGGHYHINGAHLLFDVTGLADGPHDLRFTVVDTAGQSASTDVRIIVANSIQPFAAWRLGEMSATQAANPAVGGPDADIDGDGLTTVGEFALGGRALVPDGPRVLPVLGTDGGLLTLTFTETVGANDITYSVEGGNDLSGFSTAGITLVDVVELGARRRVTWRDGTAPAPGVARTLRLVITLNPVP